MKTIQVSLVGQPNVGKSMLFSRLTGVGVITSNYPGTTVEFEEATVETDTAEIHFHDLPGTYSLSVNSEDEKVVLDMLRDEKNDMVIVVINAMNPEPGIVLALEIVELELPVMIAMNKWDEASKRFEINFEKMSKTLRIPVLPVSSKTGEGIKELLDAICGEKAQVSDFTTQYDEHVEEGIRLLRTRHPEITRGQAVKCLENIYIGCDIDKELVKDISDNFRKIHRNTISTHIARDRYGEAHAIVIETVVHSNRSLTKKEKISDMTINPSTGIPILICVIIITFAVMVFAGGQIADVIDFLYDKLGISKALTDFGSMIGGEIGFSIMKGIDTCIQAILGLVIPYIMLFYILLGIFEDSGYLPRAVVLLDRTMHKLGLHGSGFIPMMVGLGCNTPAILATRTLRSHREKVILCSMICMAIPCSAQLAIITGVTSKYGSIFWLIGILAILFTLAVVIGLILNRVMKHEPSNLAMELPELQLPLPKNVLKKMWMRSSDFFKLAVPFLLVGSIIIEIMIHYNTLDAVVEPMAWLTRDLLGLPPVVIICFIIGIVRKEMSFAMLGVVSQGGVTALSIMEANPYMFIVYGVVMSIYIPCLATLAVMKREVGLKNTVVISVISVVVAVTIGAIVNQCFKIF